MRHVGRRRLRAWAEMAIATARALNRELHRREDLPAYRAAAIEAGLEDAAEALADWPTARENTLERRLRLVQ